MNLFSSGILFVLQFGVTIIMARLLAPSDYGKMAMVVSTYGFVLALRDLGLSMATIQQKTISEEQLTGLFWVNVLVGVVFGVGIAATAPLIAHFYDLPLLTYLALGYAVTAPMSCFGAQHAALLRRRMEFGKLAICRQVSWLCGSLVGIVAAAYGMGVWSLMLMQFSMAVVQVLLVWAMAQWRPGRAGSGGNVRPLIVFGGKLTGCNLVGHFGQNIDSVLLGFFYGEVILGIYNRAQALMAKPLSQLTEPILSAIVPAFAKKADDTRALEVAVAKMLAMIAATTCFVMPLLLVYADVVVDAVLGEAWSGTASIISALAVFGFVEPCFRLLWNLMAACGKAGELLRWQFFSVLLVVLGIISGLPWGAQGVAVAYSVTGLCVRTPAMIWYVGRSTGVSSKMMFRAIAPFVLFGGFLTGALFILRIWVLSESNVFVSLGGGALLAIIIYPLMILAVPSARRSIQDLMALASQGFSEFSKKRL